MAFCGNCGTQVQDGVKFCPKCGAEIGAAPAQQQPAQQPTAAVSSPAKSESQDAQDNKVMAVLAYILFFVPLLTGAHKTSPFAKYHTNQGTVLFIGTIAWSIAYSIVTAIFSAILLGTGAWRLWSVITTILGLLWFVPAALCVLGIVNAAAGKLKPLPFIGKITIIK
ncbi:MAG: zinc-ribbon domain-containing protein [Oscillospiraceae bacterium]|jgi:uncharacterized membrane protein|nr:zinc-ribbon domain-containing protein [Oscillospiraceae bacterium]